MRETTSKKQLREFGLLIGFGFPLLIGWLIPSLLGYEFTLWTLWVGITSLILGLTESQWLHHPYKVCMALVFSFGTAILRIILGIIFILLVQPIACIMRLTGYDPLRRRRKDNKTYRQLRHDHKTDLTRMF